MPCTVTRFGPALFIYVYAIYILPCHVRVLCSFTSRVLSYLDYARVKEALNRLSNLGRPRHSRILHEPCVIFLLRVPHAPLSVHNLITRRVSSCIPALHFMRSLAGGSPIYSCPGTVSFFFRFFFIRYNRVNAVVMYTSFIVGHSLFMLQSTYYGERRDRRGNTAKSRCCARYTAVPFNRADPLLQNRFHSSTRPYIPAIHSSLFAVVVRCRT